MKLLKKFKVSKVIKTGSDNVELDSPTFEIIGVNIDTKNKKLFVEVLHEIEQKTLTQKHSRTMEIDFNNLPLSVKNSGKNFLNSIEQELLKLPQYSENEEI